MCNVTVNLIMNKEVIASNRDEQSLFVNRIERMTGALFSDI